MFVKIFDRILRQGRIATFWDDWRGRRWNGRHTARRFHPPQYQCTFWPGQTIMRTPTYGYVFYRAYELHQVYRELISTASEGRKTKEPFRLNPRWPLAIKKLSHQRSEVGVNFGTRYINWGQMRSESSSLTDTHAVKTKVQWTLLTVFHQIEQLAPYYTHRL